mmetsp:Transcript_32155/g.58161  ORF Transcript_32155/g.58161 Transcript_32155/m.58161 type:complete len:80 (+) Transcript_32155:74-313(+)
MRSIGSIWECESRLYTLFDIERSHLWKIFVQMIYFFSIVGWNAHSHNCSSPAKSRHFGNESRHWPPDLPFHASAMFKEE